MTQYAVRFQHDVLLKFPPEGSEQLASQYPGALTHEQAAASVVRKLQHDGEGEYRRQLLMNTDPRDFYVDVKKLEGIPEE